MKMEGNSIKEKEEKIEHLRELLKIIFSNLGRIVMDLTQPIKDIDKIRLYKAVDLEISLARELLQRISDFSNFPLSEEEKEKVNEIKKKIESAAEIAKEVKEKEIEEV